MESKLLGCCKGCGEYVAISCNYPDDREGCPESCPLGLAGWPCYGCKHSGGCANTNACRRAFEVGQNRRDAWVSVGERLPTEADADAYGHVLAMTPYGSCDVVPYETLHTHDKHDRWQSLSAPPEGKA